MVEAVSPGGLGRVAALTPPLRIGASSGSMPECHVASPHAGTRLLLARLHEEADRQVPFSQAKLLFREAASAIGQLDAALTRVTTELEKERAGRQAR